MSTEADVPAPECETRREQGGNIIDQATNISINKLSQEEKTQADTPNEPPTVEGENFLRTLTTAEVHCEVNNISPDASKVNVKPDQTVKDDTKILLLRNPKLDDQQLDITANEEISSKRIQQNAEESNGSDKNVIPVEYSMYSPVMTSGMKAGDILHDPDLDDVRRETQLSKDTTSDPHGQNDSFTKKMALSEENLQESSLLNVENKDSNMLCISEGENLNVQVKPTNDRTGDGRTTEEDISCNLTSDVSKNGECPNNQNKMTSEHEGLGNERNFAGNLDNAADKVSHENSIFMETITDATSNSDELQSKDGLNSSLCKEEDIPIQKGDRAVTTAEDSGILLENTVNEGQGEEANKSKTLEDIVTNHSNPKATAKTDESSLIQTDGSPMERDEQLKRESEKLPLTEVSTGGTNDNESAVIDMVKDEDEDLTKAELFENEKNTSTSVKEQPQMEKPIESFQVAPENIKASNLGQDNETTSSPEEQSTNANLQGTSDETEEKTIDAVDTEKEVLESFSTSVSSSPKEGSINAKLQEGTNDSTDENTIDEVDTQKEVLENFSTIVSNKEIEENLMIKVDGSEMKIAEHLEKKSEKMSSPLPLASEATDADSMVVHDTGIEGGEHRKAELCEYESSTESMLESKIEKPEDSLLVASEDILAFDLGQDIETSCFKEQSLTAHPQGILDEKTDNKTVDAAETKEQTLENVAMTVLNEKTEENSLIQVDGSQMKDEEHLEKETENPFLIKECTGKANDDELTVMDEVKIEDANPRRAELFEKKKNIESALLKEEVLIEKPVESFHEALEDIKASDLGQHTETTGFLEEQSLTENPQGILGDKTEEKTIDEADTSEKTQELQNVEINVSNEENEKNALIQVDASQMKHEAYLEREMEKPSLTETSTEDANDDKSTIIHDGKTGDEYLREVELIDSEKNIDSILLKKEHLQDDYPAGEDIETTCSLKEQSLTGNPQAIMSDKTIDATDTKKVTLEVQNVATTIPHEHTEEKSVIQVDCSQMEHEPHMEKESEIPSLTEAPTEETNDDESKNMHEPKNGDEDLIKAGLLENEKNTVSTLVKEEALVEKPIDPLQVATEDTKASVSSQSAEISSIKEQILTAYPPEISAEKIEEKTIDAADTKEETPEDIATNVPNGDNEDNSLIEEDGTQKLSLKEASTGKANDDESIITHEAKFVDESSIKTDTFENEKNTKDTLVKEEVSIESLKVATEDIKAFASIQDRETSSLEEQGLTANPQGIMGDHKEDKTNDATAMKEETPEDTNVATTIPYEGTEETSIIQVDCSQMQQSEHLEKESENSSLTEALTVDTKESALVMEEAQVEKKPIDSLQVATDDVKASVSGQDTKTSSIDEQIVTIDPQETLGANTEEKTIDAAYTNEETLEVQNVALTIPHEDTEENSLIQVDCSQMEQKEHLETEHENPSLIEAPTGHTTESILVKEEAQVEMLIDSFQLPREDIKGSASSQDPKKSSIEEQIRTANPQEISRDKTEEEAIDAAYTKEETLEDIATNVPNGDNDDNSPIEVHGTKKPSLKEASTRNANDDESTIMCEAKFEDDSLIEADLFENEKNTEGTLANEEVSTESLQVAVEDIKASALGQDRETSSLEEQSLPPNPQGIMGDHKEDKTIDATNLKEETPQNKNVVTTIPQENTEEKSVIQVDCSQMEYEEHLEKESENPSLTKAPIGDTTESILVKEEAQMEKHIGSLEVAAEDIKASASSQDTEISSIEVKILTEDPQEISGAKTKEKTFDATGMKQETLEVQQDIATNVPNGDNEDNSQIKVDGSQKPSMKEASTGNANDNESTVMHEAKFVDESSIKADLFESEKNTEVIWVKKEVSTDSSQVATEDIKASASGQDRETSSLEEQSLTTNRQGIMGDNKKDKTIDPSDLKEENPKHKNVATIVQNEDTEENSLIQVDCAQMEHEEHLETESENPSLTEALKRDVNDESTIMREASTLQEGLHVKDHDVCIGKGGDHMKDVANHKNQDNTLTSHEATEDQSKEAKNHKNDIIGQATEEKVDDNAKITNMGNDIEIQMTDNQHHPGAQSEATVNETIKIFQEVGETYHDPDGYTDNKTQTINENNEAKNNVTISSTKDIRVGDSSEDEMKRLEPDTEVPREIENVDIKAKTIELNEEEGYLKDLQMAPAVNIAAHEEKYSDSIAIKTPCTKSLDASKDMLADVAEDPNCKQEKSSVTKVSEEHMMISNENVANITSFSSAASALNSDHEIVGEANSCDDKTDTDKMGVLDDSFITIPTNENPIKTDPKESTEAEAQVPNGEKEEELMQQDPRPGTDQKDLEERLPINASQDVSESNGMHGEEEKRNSDNHKQISDSSNSVALEEVSSSNVAADEFSTPNPFQESRRETRPEAEDEEAQKQDADLHVLALIKDSSMEKKEKDIQLCLASAHDSDITQEMQKLEEASLPSPDEKIIGSIIEKTDIKESEVIDNAAEDKDIEKLEQDVTTKSFLDDQKPTKSEQEETEYRQEKIILDETVGQIKESTSIPVANDFLPQSFKENSEVDHCTTERELAIDREELDIEKTVTGEDEEIKIDKDKDKDEEEEAGVQKISDFSSAAPDLIEANNQDVARMLPEAPEEILNLKITEEVNIFHEAIDATESIVINNSTGLEEILINSSSIGSLETKIDDEAPESIEITPTATEGQEINSTSVEETSTLISQCDRDEYVHASIGSVIEEKSDSNEVEFAHRENKSRYESKNQVLESIAPVQSSDIISKAEGTKTNEENLEAAAEIKSAAEVRFEPKETTKVNILSKKIKEKDEDVEDYHLCSCKEAVITESRPEDEVKQEEEMNTQKILEAIKYANETEKVSKVFEEPNVKAVVESEENLLANESIDRSLHQEVQGKSVEEFTTILDTEESHGLDHVRIKTRTEDSGEEVKSSTVALPEDEDNRKGADGLDNVTAKDEGLLNQNSNTSVIDAAAEELPKRLEEKMIFEAAPTKTVQKTIGDSEGKKENANTIMMQQQEEDNKSKNESVPLPESTQGKESKKQDQKDEICSSDEVPAKDEENLMHAKGKSKEEAHKADTWSKPTEYEDCVEAEKLDFSSHTHTKDTSEVSDGEGAQDIPKDNENSTAKNDYYEEKYQNESTESQISTVSKDIELIEQASKATRINSEMQETRGGSDSGAVPVAKGVDSTQMEEVSDKCKGMVETTASVEPTNISASNIMQEYTVGTSLEAKDQLTKLHDWSQESHGWGSEVKMVQKDGPVDFQRVADISEDVQELNEGSVEVSSKENPAEADPNQNIEARVSSDGQEVEAIQKATISEALEQEIEEQQLRMTSEVVSKAKGVNCVEEKSIDDKCSDLIENSSSAATEMVSESNIHRSSVENTAQSDQNQESQKQIDSLPILPHIECSDIAAAEKDLPVHFAGLDGTDVTELEVIPLPAKDKHVVLEADHTRYVNPENSIGNKNISVIQHGDSAKCSQGKGEISKPSKVEQEEANCVHEERTSQETTKSREKPESKEIDNLSLSNLLQVSVKETSQMADHSAIEKEPTTHWEDLQAEKTAEAEHEDSKTDEEKDDEEESSGQRKSDLGSEAPVTVDVRDADVKVAHKKSHNILSGVGSKVKHSIAKVKKAITGKSSHPKPPSPK